MSIKYCPKCARKHEYSITAPTKCDKCGTVFASAFVSAIPKNSQFANNESPKVKGFAANVEIVDEDYYDEGEVESLKNQIIANLQYSPIIIEGKMDAVKFGDLVAEAKAGRV